MALAACFQWVAWLIDGLCYAKPKGCSSWKLSRVSKQSPDQYVPSFEVANSPSQTCICHNTSIISDTSCCIHLAGGNGDSVYTRLMAAIGRADMGADNPKYATNAERCQHEEEIMGEIATWVERHTIGM